MVFLAQTSIGNFPATCDEGNISSNAQNGGDGMQCDHFINGFGFSRENLCLKPGFQLLNIEIPVPSGYLT